MTVTVEGVVIKVADKTTRDGNEYQGVTLKRGDNGAVYWFGNYDYPAFKRGQRLAISAESEGQGNNITFLNKVRSVEKLGDAAVETRPAAAPAAAPADSSTGWEDPEDEEICPEPVAGKVTENAAPLGTLDDIAEGTDPSSYGGVILFKKGTTKDEVEVILRAIAGVVASTDIREYDGKKESPVFYIP